MILYRQGFRLFPPYHNKMNWLQKICQSDLLSSEMSVLTKSLGEIQIRVETTFESYDRWWNYQHGPAGWDDSQTRDNEAHNRSIQMEPNCRLTISHAFADWMPEEQIPDRTLEEEYEMDAFDMIGDEMQTLKNDHFVQVVKLKDIRNKIDQWLFMPISGRSRIGPDERESVEYQLSVNRFEMMEELFQQWTSRK